MEESSHPLSCGRSLDYARDDSWGRNSHKRAIADRPYKIAPHPCLLLGEGGAATAATDEGCPHSDSCGKIFSAIIPLISQKSKISASFPQGKPLRAIADRPYKIAPHPCLLLGEGGAATAATDEGCPHSDSCGKTLSAIIPLISQKSKISASFPQGKPFYLKYAGR